MKTVTAFGRQQLEIEKYSLNLDDAAAAGRKKGIGNGIGMVTPLQSVLVCQCACVRRSL